MGASSRPDFRGDCRQARYADTDQLGRARSHPLAYDQNSIQVMQAGSISDQGSSDHLGVAGDGVGLAGIRQVVAYPSDFGPVAHRLRVGLELIVESGGLVERHFQAAEQFLESILPLEFVFGKVRPYLSRRAQEANVP